MLGYFRGWKKVAAERISAALDVRETACCGVWFGLGQAFFVVLRRPRRLVGRSVGGSPISSAIQMEVTNFFMPWLSKSTLVRSELDSVMTPVPY